MTVPPRNEAIGIDDIARLPGRGYKVVTWVTESAKMPASEQQGSAWTELRSAAETTMQRAPAAHGRMRSPSFLRNVVSKRVRVEYENVTGPEAAALLRAVEDIPSIGGTIQGLELNERMVIFRKANAS